ncbi:hypothetical protein [Novosphingobium sp. KACC 22771]|uniref:hypothetical protein n=1 Tax=Novosphingobium sp. KACC 22771 TaxID=3025670 RepID=UPI0023672C3E|nr:hypothetical protein [Novosphingobium sp. KACC 22771]WDF71979.1 hypothetical protein PQ467_14430 [Novosphingobium sp. KACC 22771]
MGLCLLVLVLWGSLWAGFENFNVAKSVGRSDWLPAFAYVLVNFALVALAFWMLRGGPKLIREKK